MHCPSCRHENRTGAKFCEECATPLRLACPSCGSELRPTAKFCDECGAAVAGGAPASPPVRPASARKVVTVVFADLAGSTALHERVDPESARRVMEAYYAALRGAVERHGGTVVKLLGDGVMAAFGVPHVAEDDAIRAVRAGVAMQGAFRTLIAEQAAVLGDVGLRVAINTGEVVVTGDDDDVVGDPVNVAARLQQEARDGDVVVGEATRRLVDALVTLEPLGSFALKGRAEAVRAHRVVSLETPTAATTATFVGREEELERIGAVYEAAVRAPATRLAVLLASAGLGKSRLIGEFGRRRGEAATVVAARCDAAGGATFAPLAEALRELLGIEAGAPVDAARAAIEAALPRDDDGARVASGIAALLAGSPATPEETFFVVRRLLAGIAGTKPVVLVIDDLQWAEPLLLDLVEHLVQWGTGVPLLVLVGARPELRDVRSSLVAPGGLVSDVVTLSGLDAGAAMRLAANVIGAADLPAAVAAKVLATSEGNPLFIGELVRMLVEEGALTREGDRWTVGTALATLEMPPTIHALLAARIERLRPDERTVLERAAVVGRQFSRSAVAALLPGAEVDLDARLEALRRSELIERDTGWLLGEPVLRFHHVLIRDAAYRRLLKETRAELHERLADWIEDRIGDSTMVIRGAASPEQDETIGRHLEQAHQLRSELGTLGPDGKRLGDRAANRLASAGRAALARDDVSLAAGLLGRALGCLEPDDTARADLALDHCEALLAAGDVTQAATAIDELGRFTSTSPRLHAWRTCFAGQLTVLTAPEALRTTADEVATAATQLAALGDPAGEASAHYVQALALARLGRVGGCEAALDHALAAARRAGDRRRANTVLAIAPLAALWGPSPVTRASGRCLDVVRVLRITQGAPAVEAVALSCQGVLEALRGRTDAAKRMIAAAREMVEELGIAQRLFETDASAGLVALLEGDGVAAERSLRGAYEGFRDLGLGIDAARAAALLGRALLAQGRGAEAEALSHESEALAGDDLKAAIAWRGVRAEALARRGEHAAAAELASAAVEIAATTDALLDHADARLALAVALRAAGRDREADAEERRAVELWEAKGATLLAERAGRRGATSDTARAGSEQSDAGAARARVALNLNTAMLARFDTAIANRDLDALRATFRDDFEEVDHTLGSRYGLDETMASMQRLLRSRDPRYHVDPLATLGPTLLLARRHSSASGATGRRYDVGPYENEVIHILEVDDQSLLVRSEVFGCDHLGDAIARLYERHAELLPAGPERDRAATTARLVTAMLTRTSERLEDVTAPDVQAVDHRTVDDVLALGTEGLLRRTTESGTIRATGGTFTNTSLLLSIFGPDGRQARFEMFDVGHEADALARYEELTARAALPRGPVRRVRPNAATAWQDRFDAAFAACDADLVDSLFAERFEEVDHPTGSTYGRDGALVSLHRLLDTDPRYHHESLATLGDSLVLARRILRAEGLSSRRFDVGAYEYEAVQLIEVDDRGLVRRSEVFAPDRLVDGVTRLYERYAELQPEGAARDRAATSAHSMAVAAGPLDPERMATVWASTYRIVDHRVFGTWTARSGAEAQEHFRRQLDLAPDFAHRFEDVLALEPHALLVRESFHGTSRTSGGTFENRICAVYHLDPDGLQAGAEAFEAEQGAEALARFEELTASQEPPRAPSRRVRPNRATVMFDRATAAINARNMPAFEQTVADDFVYVHHSTGVTFGKREQLAVWRSAFRAERLAYRYEPLAVLGESLLLGREWFSVTGLKERVFDAFGPAEIHNVFVMEWDGEDRVRRMEIFAPDHLGDAVARLYERYAQLLPEGPARDRATATACSLAIVAGPIDLERWATGLAPTVRSVDHRVFGPWTASNRAEVLQHLRLQLDLAPDFTHRLDDVITVDPYALAVRDTYYGTARDPGGAFENPVCEVWVFGTDGLLTRNDIFEAEQTAEALAYVDELTTPTSPPPPLARFENDASRHGATCVRLFAAGDYDTHRRLFAEQFRYHDRRRMALLELDYDRFEAFVRYAGDGRTSRVDFRTLATRGERLALWRAAIQVAGGDVGPSEIEFLNITELDDRGLATAYVRFDTDDLDAAYAELDRRYVVRGVDLTLGDAINRRQWDTLASFLAPTFVEYDHRRPSLLGTVQGPEDWVTGVHTLTDLAPDVVIRVEHLRLHARGRLFQSTWHGTRDGGRFELPMLGVHELDEGGAVVRADLYDLDHADEAFARFDEIPAAPGVSSRRSTSASGTMDRIAEALAVGFETDDWSELRAICAPGFTFEDRQTHSRVSGDVEMLIASARERMRSGARAQRITVGLMGDRIQFGRTLWVGGPPGGEFEIEYLATSEVDEAGRLRRFVMADVDAADELRRDAWARWVAIDPSVAPHLEILGNVLRAWETQDVDAFAAILTENLIVEDRRRTGTGRSDGREAYLRSVVTLWDLAPDTHLDGGWDWLATAPGISAYRARRFGRVPDGGDFESEFLVVTVHDNGKTSRIEVFEADDEAGALERFEALRPDRPTLVRRSATMERAFEPIRTAWERRHLDDIRALVAPSFRYEDRGRRALVVGDVDTWIESMRFWPAGTHARTDEIVGSLGDRITVDRAGWSGTSDGAAFEIERLRLLEVDAEGRLSAAIHFDLDDRAAVFREAERRFRAGEAAGCESQAVIAEMIRRLDAQDWDGFRESLSPDLVHRDHRVLGLGSLDRETWIASFRALADLAVELRQEVFGVLAWNHHGRVSSVLQRGMVKDGGPFENAFVVLVMAAGGLVDRVEVFDPADASLAVERLEALSGGLEERGAE